MADDPWLASGRKVLSGGGDDKSAAPATDDPWLKSGREALSTATPGSETKSTSTSTSYDLDHSWLKIPFLHNLGAGLTQGVRDVLATGAHAADWVDQRVPFLASLDKATIGDPAKLANALDEARRGFEASPEGQSYTGQGGRIAGSVVATLPLAGPIGGAAATGTNALLRAVPSVVRWLGSMAAAGGAGGATYGALTAGGSDKPAGEYIAENAELGAVLGPVGSVVGKGVGLGGRLVKGGYNYATGRSAAQNVEQAMAEARARAGGGTSPEPPTAPEPAPTGTTALDPDLDAAKRAYEAAAARNEAIRGGGPQPAGAQITPSGAVPVADRSAEIAGKVRALDQIISDGPNVNRGDWTEYVRGNRPTKPEGLGDANLAGIQRQIEADNPNYANFRKQAKENRVDHFERRSGIPEQLDELEKDIAKWDQETLGPVWRNKQPVDASDVETLVKGRLNSPEAQIGPVEDALKEVEKRLYKRGTTELQDDPQMLYGARRHISWMLSRAGRQTNPAYGTDDVMRELIGVRDQIDKAIEPGASGFKAWITEHAAKMRDVDRMDVLQTMRQKLFAAGGEITQGKLAAALKSLRTSMNSSGAHPAHSLTIEDLEMLRDLNKDLLRENNKWLSKPLGSPTSRNDQVLIEHGLDIVSDAAGHIPGGKIVAQEALGRIARRNALRQRELFEREFLTPDNPLTPP